MLSIDRDLRGLYAATPLEGLLSARGGLSVLIIQGCDLSLRIFYLAMPALT